MHDDIGTTIKVTIWKTFLIFKEQEQQK